MKLVTIDSSSTIQSKLDSFHKWEICWNVKVVVHISLYLRVRMHCVLLPFHHLSLHGSASEKGQFLNFLS